MPCYFAEMYFPLFFVDFPLVDVHTSSFLLLSQSLFFMTTTNFQSAMGASPQWEDSNLCTQIGMSYKVD